MQQGLAVFTHSELLGILRFHERHHTVHALLRVGSAQLEAWPAGGADGSGIGLAVHRPAKTLFLRPENFYLN